MANSKVLVRTVEPEAARKPRAKSNTKPSPKAVDSVDERSGSVDQIVAMMVRGVYEGWFSPGQKLVELDLKERFGVGRGTIREALRRLEAEGLLKASFHRGARIGSFTRDEARDMLEINENVVALAASLAAQRLDSSDDVAGLRKIIAQMIESSSNLYGLGRLRFDFMAELVRLTRNKQLYRYLPRYDAAVLRAQFPVVGGSEAVEGDIAAYERMVRYIVARDAEAAAEAGRQYVRSWSRNIQSLPDEYFDKG